MRISVYMVSLTWRSVGDQLDIDMVSHVSALTINSGGLRHFRRRFILTPWLQLVEPFTVAARSRGLAGKNLGWTFMDLSGVFLRDLSVLFEWSSTAPEDEDKYSWISGPGLTS